MFIVMPFGNQQSPEQSQAHRARSVRVLLSVRNALVPTERA
jgi:hypothetical protein